jgi:Phage tail protein (Tail_P2_I)
MPELSPQPSINDSRTQALAALIARLGGLDLTPLLVYRLSSTPDGALPFLAWQFDVTNALYALLVPGDDQRAMVGEAIALKRFMGTPYAVKTALKSLGWTAPSILEGQASWGGASWPADQGWAVCRLLLPLTSRSVGEASGWDSATSYPAGSLVFFNGNYFWANGAAAPGVVPQFSSIDEVADVDSLGDVDTLTQAPWIMLSPENLARPLGAADLAAAIAAFHFFAPARCWLDGVWFLVPPLLDDGPAPTRDLLDFGGIHEVGADAAPTPTDALLISIALATLADPYPAIAPLQSAHYHQKGHNQGANQPQVADEALVINGVIHGESE